MSILNYSNSIFKCIIVHTNAPYTSTSTQYINVSFQFVPSPNLFSVVRFICLLNLMCCVAKSKFQRLEKFSENYNNFLKVP